MSLRPCDWSVVGYGCDPIPGDPGMIQATAKNYQDTANAIDTAFNGLGRLSLDQNRNRSQGVAKLREDIDLVRQQLTRVSSRVSGAAQALNIYYPRLRDAQEDSYRAWQQATQAMEAGKRAEAKRNHAATRFNACNDPDIRQDIATEYNNFNTQVASANRTLSTARAQIARAITQRDNAAIQAKEKLKDIEKTSDIKDNFFDKVIDFANGVMEFISVIIDNIMAFIEEWKWLLDAISFVCGFLAFLPAPIGPICFAIGLIAGAIALLPGRWNTVKAGLKSLTTSYKAVNGFTTVSKAIEANGEFAKTATSSAIETGFYLLGAVGGAGAVVKTASAATKTGSLGARVGEAFRKEGLKEFGKAVGEKVAEEAVNWGKNTFFDPVVDAVVDTGKNVYNGFKNLFNVPYYSREVCGL